MPDTQSEVGGYAVIRREGKRFVIDFDYGDANCKYFDSYGAARLEMSRLLAEGAVVHMDDRARQTEAAHGPSLAGVMAFALAEAPRDVALLESVAANRMAKIRGWVGWRVCAMEFTEEVDELARIKVCVEPVGAGYRPDPVSYEFLVGTGETKLSKRFDAFLRACGVTSIKGDDSEVVGRYFATKNGGRGPADFGPLTNSLVSC